MKYDQIVYPSTQLYATLPEWISEQYPNFVQFVRRAFEANERLGFGQDMLQNIEKYRDFDFYKQPIVETGTLDANLPIGEIDSLTLVDGFGFPEKNGVLYFPTEDVDKCGERVVGEVVLYRRREGNVFYDLERAASATIDLGTFVKNSKYVYTTEKNHIRGDKVHNLSVLFLSSMLETIHQTFAVGIDSKWIADPIDHGTLLERFRDFFQAKGTKLGIKALFKFLFAENDVDVTYPGDRMIEPSESTWTETFIVRSVPLAELLVTPIHNYILPDRLINRELQIKSYNDLLDDTTKDRVIGRAICDYVSSYEHNDTTQYEFYIQKNNVSGNFPANPFTKLTRTLGTFGSRDDNIDVTTITVETTLGFPESGMIFIGTEGIYYGSKTFNQFLDCKRGFINVEYDHPIGETVYGPFFIEGKEEVVDPYGRTDVLISRSWPLGLVSDVEVVDPGLLHETTDEVYINGPGRIDPREPAISAWDENYDDKLITQGSIMPYMADHRDRTAGVSGVYFDSGFVFVTSTTFPFHEVGEFSVDYTVGPEMQAPNALYAIPRREEIKSNFVRLNEDGKREYFFHDKGYKEIGVFSNGVPAFSNVSNLRLIQGRITEYQILGQGQNYKNPTLLVNDVPVDETITLDEFGIGRVLSITATNQTNYTQVPPLPRVEVTGGKDAVINLEFDRFGRCINAIIEDGGKYYNDVPALSMVDSFNVGKGGALSCTVRDGSIDSVTIENPGLDYKAVTTTCVVTPVGSGCEVLPVVQYYQFNRPEEVYNNRHWRFDEGNGFLWEKDNNVKQHYGYVMFPRLLDGTISTVARINTESEKRIKTKSEDYIIATPLGAGVEHSPLMGYAFDGNPIYGGTIYANGKDKSEGFKKMFSGWVLAPDRSNVVASGGSVVGTLPPSVEMYPMGSFVEDYVFNPSLVRRKTRIMAETFDLIQTEKEEYILASTPIPSSWVLNENNAVKCNTPEYPAELYPDGVWIYVCTEVAGEPTFPYIIGTTFEDRPISQNLAQDTTPDESDRNFIIFNPDSKYRETRLEFDIDKVERYRNPSLTPTKDEIELEIAHTSEGSVSDIVVVDGKPNNSKIGDLIHFDNADTGGSGALGIVDQIDGVDVVKGEGDDIATTTISHFQRLNLKSDPNQSELDEDGFPISFTFVETSLITTTSGAEATVVKFDPATQVLDVFTYTKNLIQPGDSFRDNKGAWVTLGTMENILITTEDGQTIDIGDGLLNISEQRELFYHNNFRQEDRQLYMSDNQPEQDDLHAGDLWWSEQNGRLYIYFNDQDSSQWVCTQPIGMRPLAGALDVGIGGTGSGVGPAQIALSDSKVIISGLAPSSRPSGEPNQPGDVWWSSITGIMYIYINEWICTDPNAWIPTPYASDETNVFNELEIPEQPYEGKLDVIISYIAPTEGPNGSLIEIGTLWWSPLTGKMYIYYKDQDGSVQWVITNPVGILSTPYAVDFIPDGDGGSILPPVTPLPELPDGDGGQLGPISLNKGQSVMWFEHLKDFAAGDKIKFMAGAPGTGLEEIATIDRIVDQFAPAAAVINRGTPHFAIPDKCNVLNLTKSLYTVTTEEPHRLRIDDKFTLSGSAYDEVNGEHVVIRGGIISGAKGVTRISDGKVTGVTVTDPGRGYTSNFYVTFYGGNGVGGYGYVEVDQNTTGVHRVVIVDGGVNYTEPPEIFWGEELMDTEFQTYLSKTYPEETGLSYITSSVNPVSSIAHVKVTCPGLGYERMPAIEGVYKRAVDRGEFRVNLGGTSISDVEILDGGNRYQFPVAVFYDIQGSGTGASAKVTVVDGKISSIDMIEHGSGYVEPAMLLVETTGKFIALTNDIGKIESMKIFNPGRAVSPDRSLKPEIMIETRLIVQFETYTAGSIIALDGRTDYTFLGLNGYTANSVVSTGRDVSVWNNMSPGDKVYQGTEDGEYKQVVAEVVDYDDRRQILTVKHIMGNLKDNQYLYDENGTKAMVLKEGQADCRIVVGGISSPEGRFIDDTSMISSSWAHIQDSYYYQKFSYSIQSPMQQHQFDEFVQEIIHPAGFIMFSDLEVRQVLPTEIMPLEAIISGPSIPILSPDNYNDKYTSISQGEPREELTNPALGPDIGTAELGDK